MDQPSALSPQLSAQPDPDELAGRASYEAFCAQMRAWLPPGGATPWTQQAERVRQAWIAAAKAARAI